MESQVKQSKTQVVFFFGRLGKNILLTTGKVKWGKTGLSAEVGVCEGENQDAQIKVVLTLF